jgi:lysyl-tRNA synthetase, class II
MGNTHRGFRTVNVLTTGAGRAVYVNAQVGWVNFDIDIVINFWVNERRAKGGMTAAAGIERALTHQAVNAGFSTQPAVGVIANDFDGHRFNARDFTFGFFDDFGLKAARFRPTQVHAHQHAGPVLGFGAKENEELEALNVEVAVAGRMMTRRIMGKASFVTLQDVGGRIQLYVARDDLAEGVYNDQFKKWDLGDIIAARGKLFKTKTGELSIHCTELRLLTKALRPLPDKFHGLQDQEARYRQRYLDLISNDESRNTFKVRSQILAGIRQFMVGRGFMEVETPMMQVIPGGASARPFITHHNALDLDMYLRIAPELYLKRLVVGGFERVFEINRNFRNEGISVRHNPEFTMMELYMAYADYKDLIELTESLFRTLAQDILGNTAVPYGDQTFDFGKPFEKLTMREAIKKYRPETEMADLDNFDSAKAIAESIGIKVEKSWGLGRIVTEIFEEVAEAHLIQPTFITEYPAEVSPLARRNDVNPEITDRFEFFIGGREIGNGFSELNDAEDQAQRFQDQVDAKAAGDDEAMFYDEDYVTALEHGLPPTAGLGIGIDRMVMLFTNSHTIRDVILFPAMRPQK